VWRAGFFLPSEAKKKKNRVEEVEEEGIFMGSYYDTRNIPSTPTPAHFLSFFNGLTFLRHSMSFSRRGCSR
jgi:hypothetical protein